MLISPSYLSICFSFLALWFTVFIAVVLVIIALLILISKTHIYLTMHALLLSTVSRDGHPTGVSGWRLIFSLAETYLFLHGS